MNIPYGAYGYERHLRELAQELRWARQQERDFRARGNEVAANAWRERADKAQSIYDHALAEA